jgi:hypothetical protein
MALKENGTLPLGVEYAGRLHRDFELRPEMIKDVLDVEKEESCRDSNTYTALFMLSRELVKLGDIPKEAITPELLKGMASVDFNALLEARSRLRESLGSFRETGEGQAEAGAGPA